MKKEILYDREFYLSRNEQTQYSATKIIDEILKYISPKSVIDLGCGIGTFLNVFQQKDSEIEIVGCDGDYVPTEYKVIKKEEFVEMDLSKKDFAKIIIEKKSRKTKFDLAITLEVAEHLKEECADDFVKNLCELSDVIVFSAAIPGQGGVGHINEQFVSWWREKFRSHGYNMYDFVRPAIWNDSKIKFWYRQNIVIFSKRELTPIKELCWSEQQLCDVIHPQTFLPYLKERSFRRRFLTRVFYKLYRMFDFK